MDAAQREGGILQACFSNSTVFSFLYLSLHLCVWRMPAAPASGAALPHCMPWALPGMVQGGSLGSLRHRLFVGPGEANHGMACFCYGPWFAEVCPLHLGSRLNQPQFDLEFQNCTTGWHSALRAQKMIGNVLKQKYHLFLVKNMNGECTWWV